MADQGTPRFVVRRHDPAGQRQRMLWLAGAWALTVLLAFALAWVWSQQHVAAAPDRAQLRRLRQANAELSQQVATLKRAQQVATIAADDLRHSLADRAEEISGLRADLAFYSRLIGGGGQRSGLNVHSVYMQPVSGGSRAYNVTITLTQNARRGEKSHGHVDLALEGVRGDQLARLGWDALGGPSEKQGMRFSFKYFQQVHGTLIVPKGFVPNRVRVVAQVQGGADVTRTFAWNDALKSPEESDVQ